MIKARVSWSKEEIDLVLTKAVEHYLVDKMSKSSAIRKAQEDLLPKERWRHVNSSMIGCSGSIGQLYRRMIRERMNSMASINPASPTTLDESILEEENLVLTKSGLEKDTVNIFEPVKEISVNQEESVTIEYSAYDAFVDSLTNLVEDAFSRVAEGFMGKMQEAFDNRLGPRRTVFEQILSGKHNPEGTSVVKNLMPSVLVIGFKPSNQSEMDRRFANRLKIKYWFDNNMKTLNEKAKEVDYVIAAMFGTPHAAIDQLRLVKKPVIRVTGGNTATIQLLEKLAVEKTL